LRAREQGEDIDIIGKSTSKDGRARVWQSVPARQRTEYIGDPLQPTFDVEMALNDDDDEQCKYVRKLIL